MKRFNQSAILATAAATALWLTLPATAQETTTPPATEAPATDAPATEAPAETMPAPAETVPAPADTAPVDAAPAVDPAAPADAAGFVPPEGYTLATDWAGITADDLNGTDVAGPDGSNIGTISDVEIGTGDVISGVIVDVGGFLGMGTHTVKLGTDQVSLYKNADGDLMAHSTLTEDALKALPEHQPAG